MNSDDNELIETNEMKLATSFNNIININSNININVGDLENKATGKFELCNYTMEYIKTINKSCLGLKKELNL